MELFTSRKDFIARTAQTGALLAMLGSAAISSMAPQPAQASEIVQGRRTDAIVTQVVSERTTPANEIDTIKMMARRMEALPEYPMMFKHDDLREVSSWFAGRKGWVLGETMLGNGPAAKPWVVAVYDGKTDGDARERLGHALGASGGKVFDPAHAVRNAKEHNQNATMNDVKVAVLSGADLGKIVSRPLWQVEMEPISLERTAGTGRGRG